MMKLLDPEIRMRIRMCGTILMVSIVSLTDFMRCAGSRASTRCAAAAPSWRKSLGAIKIDMRMRMRGGNTRCIVVNAPSPQTSCVQGGLCSRGFYHSEVELC